MKHFLIGVILIFTAIQWGEAAWILGKAKVAQILIANAWKETLEEKTTHKAETHLTHSNIRPWSWADIWPVARLQWLPKGSDNEEVKLNKAKEDVFVLSGAHGEALSFGPGHLHGTDAPGAGFSVIAGHRDTHFSFLENIRKNDLLKIQNTHGKWSSYRIKTMEVRHIDNDPLFIDESQNGLLLITCYPFDSISSGGPLRYIVWAEPEDSIPKLKRNVWKPEQQLVYETTERIVF